MGNEWHVFQMESIISRQREVESVLVKLNDAPKHLWETATAN